MEAYALLGIIQGIFEWIPISSEGVVALVSQFLIREVNPIDLALFLHLGTLLAVLVYFRKDWQTVLTLKNSSLLRFLITATLVSLAIGYPFYYLVKSMVIGSSLLLIMGSGLLLTAYFHRQKRSFEISFNKLAIITGFLQGLSVIPGLSRSASTIFGLSLAKSSPSEILKISYMMSAPVVLASSIFLFFNNPSLALSGWPALAISFIVGFLGLSFLINIARRINFFKFALIFGLVCFLGAAIQSLLF